MVGFFLYAALNGYSIYKSQKAFADTGEKLQEYCKDGSKAVGFFKGMLIDTLKTTSACTVAMVHGLCDLVILGVIGARLAYPNL
jgi:hypothetical protein